MKKQSTELVFILDKSGSMTGLEKDTIGGYNSMLEKQREFVFLGANIDAVETASSLGIESSRAVDYIADSEGTELNYRVMSEAVVRFRQEGKIEDKDFDEIRRRNK